MTRSHAERYPGLERLFGAYLHQDFDAAGGTAQDAMRRFVREVAPHAREVACASLCALLRHVSTDRGLRAALSALGCAYRPEQEARLWLREVVALLRA